MNLKKHENKEHIPVLLNEVLEIIGDCKEEDDLIIDATFGRGGYSIKFLEKGYKVIAIDRDKSAYENAKKLETKFGNKFLFINEKFSILKSEIEKKYPEILKNCVKAIVFDLGVSSPQLDKHERGFSFKKNGPLDMRMGKNTTSAYDIVNNSSKEDLAEIIKTFGEEKYAKRITNNIIKQREEKDIETTFELRDIIKKSIKKNFKDKIDPATRTFQGIRIAVNEELKELEDGLEGALKILKKDGKLIVVSFHSLEDRIVKKFINRNSKIINTNRHLPPLGDKCLSLRVEKKKPVIANDKEVNINPRARSARMRYAIKI